MYCGRTVVLWAALGTALFGFEDKALASSTSADAKVIEGDVIAWRRDIHRHPELSNREFRTAGLVARHLESLGLEVTENVAHTGVVGVLRGPVDGPVVGLRADMDGLPVVEQTGLPYASVERGMYNGRDVGVMHACGHDNHVAILMGVASVLSERRESLTGTVKFIFQPAEEGAPKGEEGGAKMMIAQGVLDDVDAMFGLHVSQNWEVGSAAVRSGGMMASAQTFEIAVEGSQTHGARPWQGTDPIVIGSHIVTALQTIISRQVDITRAPAVVTVGIFQAGVRSNIIPDRAVLTGTIRTFDPNVRDDINQRIEGIASQVAGSMGASARVTFGEGVPVTFNDPDLTAAMLPTLQGVYGPARVVEASLTTGAEDFSFFQEVVPGFFFFVGARPRGVEKVIPNHSPKFYADEGLLVLGVQALADLAIDFLESND